MKLRPVLLLTGPIGPRPEVVAAYITSVLPSALMSSDLILDPADPEHSTTNLKVISALRLHKLATIHGASVTRYLGRISPGTEAEVATRLRALLGL